MKHNKLIATPTNQRRLLGSVRLFLFLIFLLPAAGLWAQEAELTPEIDFKRFLERVARHNIDYAVEKFNVSMAEAEIEVARIAPDPSLSFAWSENAQESQRTGYGFSVELAKTIELGGKRGARIELARSKKELADLMLADFFRELRAQAATVYVEAMAKNEIYKLKLDSYQAMKRLSDAIRVRHELGATMKVDLLQSELETGVLHNELMQSEVECRNVASELSKLMGGDERVAPCPSDKLQKPLARYEFETLLQTALERRSDLLVARQNQRVAQKNTTLASRNRALDLDLSLGYGNDFDVLELAPAAKSFSAEISIPLKLSNFHKGDLKIARYQENQAEQVLKKVQLIIRNELAQALRSYQSALGQVENFENGLLQKSREVLSGKMYSYQRGETSLLEVLSAQRTFNEVQATYFETLQQCLTAHIGLQKAAGIWDLL